MVSNLCKAAQNDVLDKELEPKLVISLVKSENNRF